jgi:hypothetical protein
MGTGSLSLQTFIFPYLHGRLIIKPTVEGHLEFIAFFISWLGNFIIWCNDDNL